MKLRGGSNELMVWYATITNVFCANKRAGHTCICPSMVTGQPFLKLYPTPKKFGFSAAKKMKIPQH